MTHGADTSFLVAVEIVEHASHADGGGGSHLSVEIIQAFAMKALRVISCAALALLAASLAHGADAKSEWAAFDARGNLTYKAMPRGDRIMDFSFAGYMGGGVALPAVAVRKTLRPSGGDDTAAIQAALDEVAGMELSGGFRGAVLLEAGTFQSTAALTIKADGVVLRGSGSDGNGTTIQMTGKPHVCVSIGGSGSVRVAGKSVAITDGYVPAGANTFSVADAVDFKTGDTILVTRPTTAEWVKFMGMDALVRNGKKETWVSGDIHAERVITGIASRNISVDVPLPDSLDAALLSPPGASIVKCAASERIARAGVESLRIVSPAQAIDIDQPQHQALRTRALADGWIRDVAIVDTVNSVSLGGDTRRVTLENVRITHSVATVGSASRGLPRAARRSFSTAARRREPFLFVTGAKHRSNVLLNCTFEAAAGFSRTRWARPARDGCKVSGGGIDFMNRPARWVPATAGHRLGRGVGARRAIHRPAATGA